MFESCRWYKVFSPLCIILASCNAACASIDGQDLVPIAMITHYTGKDCLSLDTLNFKGYYSNSNAEPGTAESNYTYFCNPQLISSYTDTYGIRNLDSCFVDNGGDWYFQPLGFCGAFIMNGKPISVKFTSIDYITRKTVHTVYSDLNCTVADVLDAEAYSGQCFVNNPKKVNGTAEVEASVFSSIGSYQVTLPDAYNVIPSFSASYKRNYLSGVFIMFGILIFSSYTTV